MKAQYAIIAGILGLLPMAARAQDEVKVTGRVVDAAGKPVAGIDVATRWGRRVDDKMIPYQGSITNQEGRFALAVTFRGRKQTLMAQDKERKTGGLIWIEEKSASKPLEIKIAPLVHVRGRTSFKEFQQRPLCSMMIWSESFPLLGGGLRDASFSFRLPPGDYQLRIFSPDCEPVAKTISLKPDVLDVDLGTFDVPASLITKHKGKTLPPWHVTDARGVTKDVKLSDFKGKWVLLEFWGYW